MLVRNFIIEGIDGSGKSTQAHLVEEYFTTGLHRSAKLYREPGGTTSAEYIRNILKDPTVKLKDIQKLSLFCTARKFLCDELLKYYSLDASFISILDRFVPSTYAYQIYGSGIDKSFAEKVMDDICPNSKDVYKQSAIIYIDLDPNVAYERLKSRNKEMNDPYETQDFLKKVYDGYNKYFNDNKDLRLIRINGNQQILDIHNDILNYIKWGIR